MGGGDMIFKLSSCSGSEEGSHHTYNKHIFYSCLSDKDKVLVLMDKDGDWYIELNNLEDMIKLINDIKIEKGYEGCRTQSIIIEKCRKEWTEMERVNGKYINVTKTEKYDYEIVIYDNYYE